MDIYSGRSASFGFVFAFFALLTWYLNDADGALSVATGLLSDDDGNGVSLVAAVVGGLIGLPVVGRSLEYISTLIAELLRGRSDSFPNMVGRGNEAMSSLRIEGKVDPKGVYHLVYYSECDPKLRDWGHRRRNRMYASVTNALASVSAVVLTSVMTGSVDYRAIVVVLIYTIINVRVFYVELNYHDKMIEAWWERRESDADRKDARTINLNVNSTQIND